eukprot:2650458-Prymnesium_polylepis.1
MMPEAMWALVASAFEAAGGAGMMVDQSRGTARERGVSGEGRMEWRIDACRSAGRGVIMWVSSLEMRSGDSKWGVRSH